MTGGMREVVAIIDDATGAAHELTEGLKNSLSPMDKLAASAFKFNQINDILRNTSEALNMITQPSADFERSMRKANTMAGLGAKEFDALKESVSGLSHEIPVTRDLLGNGLYQVISNGVPKDNWLEFLERSAKSSVGGVADLEQVVTVTSTVIKNYGLEWDKAGYIQDKIQKTAQNGVTSFEQMAAALPRVSGNAATLGVSIDELMATFATLTGVSGNTAEVSTQLSAVFTALVKPTAEATKQAQAMGAQFDAAAIKAAGGMAPFLQNLDKTINAYSQKTGQLRESIYANLFGSAESLRALIPLTGELSDKFVTNIEDMANSAGAIDFAFEQNAGTAESWAQTWRNKFAEIGDSIYGFMGKSLPVLQFTVQLGQIMSGLGPAVMGVVKAVRFLTSAQKLQALWTNIVTGAQWLLNAALTANPIGIVVVAVGALVGGIVICWQKFAGFRAFLITMWDTVKQFGNIIKDYVINRITGLIEGVGALGKAIKEMFAGNWDTAWQEAKSGVVKITGIDAATQAYNAASGAVGDFKTLFNNNLVNEQAKDAQSNQAPDTAANGAADNGAPVLPPVTPPKISPVSPTADKGANTGGKVRNITVTIDRLIDKFTVNTTNIKEGAADVKRLVSEALTSAVNDLNYTTN